MGIITISRQYGSGGERVAENINEKRDYRIIGRREIEAKLEEIAGKDLAYSIPSEKAPGLIQRLTVDGRAWKSMIGEAVLSFAKSGRVIILGRGSFAILKDIPGVLNVLISGEKMVRMDYTAREEKISPLDAEEKILRIDKERAGFLKYYFGYDWPDPSHFNVSLSPLTVGIEKCATTMLFLLDLLDGEESFQEHGRMQIEERWALYAARNRILLSLDLDLDQFFLVLMGNRELEARFFQIPDELKDKSIKVLKSYFPGYKIIVKD
jgi:cytidylate kinase